MTLPTKKGGPAHRSEYLMIESAEIQNFRLFESLSLKGFRRVNLVVGDNGAGKTSFLEALFVAGVSNAEIGARFRVWRSMEMGPGSPQELYDGLYLSLFHNFERGRVGSIILKGSEEDTRTLKFYYDTGAPVLLPLTDQNLPPQLGQLYSPVAFEWTDSTGKTTKSMLQTQPNGTLASSPTPPRGVDPTFLAARSPFNSSENAKWFSDMSKQTNEGRFIKSLQEQFPEIEDVRTEIELGKNTVFIKYKKAKRRIPINLVSEGMNKILTILLHIAHSERTATYVDELENGIHFSRHEKMAEQILTFAREYNTQVFASTHSSEFLKSVVPVIKKHPQDFTFIRIFQENEVGKAAIIDGAKGVELIEAGLELRV